MKKILFLVLTSILILSCEKEEYSPYVEIEETNQDTTHWQAQYNNGGTLTGGGQSNTTLSGTTWVLTKYVSSFATEYPNDTIHFIDNNTYSVNNGGDRPYTLSSIPSSTNYELTLSYFFPFGGSSYSANVGYYFVDDGEINNVEFTNIQNTTSKIRAWFIKL